MLETEIGMGKTARRSFGFDEISIVPSRRTRDPRDIDISWQIDAYGLDIPVLGSSTDSVTSPATAIRLGQLGGLGVLDLEGLWTRHEDPAPALAELAEAPIDKAAERLRELYKAKVIPELISQRISEISAAGVRTAARVRPPKAEELTPHAAKAEVDMLVIAGTVVSAEHDSTKEAPLNLKTFIRGLQMPVIVGGCVSYQAALHLMRTGAAGVLVGTGSGHAVTSHDVLGLAAPQATAIADARAARMRHLDETGVYCHVIADDGMSTSGDIAKAIVCGADAVMLGVPLAAATDAPCPGKHWTYSASRTRLPRGKVISVDSKASLEEILLGPTTAADGSANLMGGLKIAIAKCGYTDLKDFQRAALAVTSST